MRAFSRHSTQKALTKPFLLVADRVPAEWEKDFVRALFGVCAYGRNAVGSYNMPRCLHRLFSCAYGRNAVGSYIMHLSLSQAEKHITPLHKGRGEPRSGEGEGLFTPLSNGEG